jgi:hypothetical protein
VTYAQYDQSRIRRLLTAKALHFDAYVLNPEKLKFWEKDPQIPTGQIPSRTIHVNLSTGPCSLEVLYKRLIDRKFECLVLGTYGAPRKDIFRAIQNANKKRPEARRRRIELFERREPDAIVCLIVYTVDGVSYRKGLIRVQFPGLGSKSALQAWVLGPKRTFVLK